MHAYIIVGASEGGRTEHIQKFVTSWNVVPIDIVPVHPTEGSIGIGQIREFEKRLQLMPYRSPYTVGVIEQSHLLTVEAQNALLKTLEEPPSKAKIILSAPHTQTLLPTVLSRCTSVVLTHSPSNDTQEKTFPSLVHLKGFSKTQILSLVDTIAIDRPNTLAFVQSSLLSLEELLTKAADTQNEKELRTWARIARSLLRAYMLLSANVTPKLVLDELFLSFT